MPRPLVIVLGLILLTLPAFLFVWTNRDLPHFGILEDDGIYLIGAKSIAQGEGYRILNVPGDPLQTKYPPLYPLYLTLAWRTIPGVCLLSFATFPLVLTLMLAWYRRNGFDPPAAWILTGLFALNPYVMFFVANLGSEVFFMAFLFAALILAERAESPRLALLAGVVAGVAYLARTAGIAMLPAAILYYWWRRKQTPLAIFFSLGMLPFIVAWMAWSRAHTPHSTDPATIYYTSYTGYQWLNVNLGNFRFVLWNNVSALLESIGSLVFPQVLGGVLAKFILQPLAIGMLLGIGRLFRQKRGELYAIFTAISIAMLLVWHFPPNQRFILPLAPIFFAGFWMEGANLVQSVREAFHHKDRSQRVVAYGFAGFLGLMLCLAAGLQVYLRQFAIPELFRNDRENARAYSELYSWIGANTSPGEGVVWENDTALYLATGRHSIALIIPPSFAYENPDASEQPFYQSIDRYAAGHNMQYVVLPKIGPHKKDEYLKSAAENPNLEEVFNARGGVIYKVGQKTNGQRRQ